MRTLSIWSDGFDSVSIAHNAAIGHAADERPETRDDHSVMHLA